MICARAGVQLFEVAEKAFLCRGATDIARMTEVELGVLTTVQP